MGLLWTEDSNHLRPETVSRLWRVVLTINTSLCHCFGLSSPDFMYWLKTLKDHTFTLFDSDFGNNCPVFTGVREPWLFYSWIFQLLNLFDLRLRDFSELTLNSPETNSSLTLSGLVVICDWDQVRENLVPIIGNCDGRIFSISVYYRS